MKKKLKNPALCLADLLKYKNPEVVARFCQDNGCDKSFGNKVFQDLLRFFFLNSQIAHYSKLKSMGKSIGREIPTQIKILDSMLIIDEMWHTFILYTKEYELFSKKYFDTYIHHEPKPTLRTRGKGIRLIDASHEVELFLTFIWDELGESVLDRWVVGYEKDFNKKSIKKMQLKAVA